MLHCNIDIDLPDPGSFLPVNWRRRGAAILFSGPGEAEYPCEEYVMNRLFEQIEVAADHSALLFLLAAFPAAAVAIIAAAF